MWMKANQMPPVENTFCDVRRCSFAGWARFSLNEKAPPEAGLFLDFGNGQLTLVTSAA